MYRHALRHHALALRLKVRRYEFGEQFPDVFAQNLFARLTHFLYRGPVGVREAPLTIHGDKHFRDTLEHVADMFFCPLELVLPELMFRHVDSRSDIPRDFASVVAHGYGQAFCPPQFSVRRLNAVADSVWLAAGYRFGTRAQHAVGIVRM